ncbi:4-hydroxy-tetrahydrodipicolinate reductase [Rubeoparvulum massiliense]|uniref:4-hydroxy-tetrahydrodipicolinate reductase n=1 Tax=Rubeoparvulum massiliense TaxID=1631346 RepID=UPI00065DBFC4|nr:4-hydroxy-tetrahydrodipicolinate reductase [Rubeoparvulum massiliense]
MNKPIRIVVAGAKGRMGQEWIHYMEGEPTFQLVAAVDRTLEGVDVGNALGGSSQAPFYTSLAEAIEKERPDCLVDFTTPEAGYRNALTAMEHGIRAVIGTTGFSEEQLKHLEEEHAKHPAGMLIAPNFAIGAVLMMQFSKMAARFLPDVEIIEMHHNQKLDAPSGTARKTAAMIQEVRQAHQQGHPNELEHMAGVRGGDMEGIRIHSVRLPGLVAHQEVIFGGEGETLHIRHDSNSRRCFMPGVALGIRYVMEHPQYIYGLEHILGGEMA